MDRETVKIHVTDGVKVVAINRPERRNALDPETSTCMARTFEESGPDESVRVLVLTGRGAAFCSGADLRSGSDSLSGPGAVTGLIRGTYHRLIKSIRHLKKPVIAMVNGPAYGFGCDLALACDIRVASEAAQFCEVFSRLGLMPDGGGTFFLPRLVGLGKALELIFTAHTIDARTAADLGLVNGVVPADALEKTVMDMAGRLAAGPTVAYGLAKDAVYRGLNSDLDSALETEAVGQGQCSRTQDFMEGITAFFEKREAKFSGK